MSLFSALTIAVSGLDAQATAINNISNNISNSQTVGYKGLDTTFDSLVTASNGSQENPGGVTSGAYYTNTVQGTLTSSTTDTNLAISGEGFFAVQSGVTNPDGTSTVSGDTLYTRQGDFAMNADGYLVNSSGFYLMGNAVDQSTGVVNTSTTVPIQISQTEDNPVATTDIVYAANLPSTATTASSFPSSTQQIYDSLGNAQDVNYTWTNTGTNTWNLNIASPTSTDVNGTALNDNLTFVFNDGTDGPSGTIQSITPVTPGTGVSPFSVVGSQTSGEAADVTMTLTYPGAGSQTINLNFGNYDEATGVTQYSGSTVDVATNTQNGVAPGSYSGVSIDSSGNVTVNYSNGQSRTVYQVPIATFDDADALQSESGGVYESTLASGTPKLSQANTSGAGQIESSELEQSNVDIASQLTSLINVQEVYDANSKTITTVNEMLQSLLNVIS